jgi:preprotein translocase subunit SecA
MVYARPWFFDHSNHVSRIPIDMPLDHYNRLPEPVRRLLIRAYSEAARGRWHGADGPGRATHRPPTDPPSQSKVGRNDPCPCGSGKKFKHCHGQLAVT